MAEDREELGKHTAQGSVMAAEVRERQLGHVAAALRTAAALDADLTGRLLVQRDSHAASPPPHRAGGGGGGGGGPLASTGRHSGRAAATKPFAGQTIDDRKAAAAAKQAMLAASFLGYKAPDGAFVQSSRVTGGAGAAPLAPTADEPPSN